MQRREVFFSGHVQGVGFRYRTQSLAVKYPVEGYVRNLPDGRVQLEVQGAAEDLDRFLAALERQMAEFIRESRVESLPLAGDLAGRFEIRF